MILITVLIDSLEFNLLETYCLGKSWLWNAFFGWRKTVDKKANGQWCYYKISRKDYKVIQETVKHYNKNNF